MLELIIAGIMFGLCGVLLDRLPFWKMVLVCTLLIGGSAVLRSSEIFQSWLTML